jgi:hypothetical protein
MLYKRSQVEDSLWAVFRTGAAPLRLPGTFRFRIKKLLDLDRTETADMAGIPLAFNDARPGGQGQDVPFSSFHAFMLGLGLELWNAGLKQNDVVFFLRHCRAALEVQHARILAAGISPYQVVAPLKGWPVGITDAGAKVADTSVYMVMDRIGLAETSAAPIASPDARQRPQFFVPKFCTGSDELQRLLVCAPPSRRTHLVVELAELAVRVDQCLAATPARRRGRPS